MLAASPFSEASATTTQDVVNVATKALLEKMSTSLLGSVAGPFASGQVLDLLGLSSNGAVDYTSYFNAIEQKLDSIKAQIGQVQQGIDQLVTDVANLPGKITDVTVQRKLDELSDKSNIVTVNFASYKNALAALASDSVDDRKAASRQLYKLFDTINAQNISIAMSDIQELFVPQRVGQVGLLSYQAQLITDAISPFASAASNFTYSGEPTFDSGKSAVYTGYTEPPNDDGLFRYELLVSGSHDLARGILNSTTADLIRAFVAIQLQGIVLMSSAWLGTINASEVQRHVDRNKYIMAQIAAFPASVAAQIDSQVASSLKRFGKPLGNPLTSPDIMWWMFGTLDGPKLEVAKFHPGYPLNGEFIMWTRQKSRLWANVYDCDMLVLVEHPWTFDNCRTVGIIHANAINTYVERVVMEACPRTNVARFPTDARDQLAFVARLA